MRSAYAVPRVGLAIATADGRELRADAAVVASGLPEVGHDWAPEALRTSPFFVADPWRPGALDVVRRDQRRAGRRAPGRDRVDDGGRRPVADRCRQPRRPPAAGHLASCEAPAGPHRGAAARGDPRCRGLGSHAGRAPARTSPGTSPGSSPRPVTGGRRWTACGSRSRRCGSGSRRRTGRSSSPGRRRVERGPPSDGARERAAVRASCGPPAGWPSRPPRWSTRSPCRGAACRSRSADGNRHDVGWVVNCTGPQTDVRRLGNPLLDDLLRRARRRGARRHRHGGDGVPHGARAAARLGRGDRGPIWTLGALRRGELWESTAVPEIRAQARALAGAVLDAIAPLPAASTTVGSSAATTRSPGRATRSACRCRRPPRPRRVQRRPRAGDAAAVRRRGADPRGRRCSTPTSRSRTPRWPCSATRPVRDADVAASLRGRPAWPSGPGRRRARRSLVDVVGPPGRTTLATRAPRR